ncbi:MAG: hypothetical protein JWM80_3147 [Cyanobacteria bacterium RYN_339]|nr:hypothetical protein [Cyanobacteria bacterium RYN_339]
MDLLSYLLMAMTMPVALKLFGMVRQARRGTNPFRRWLAVAWWPCVLPLFCLEAAVGLPGTDGNLAALLGVGCQLLITAALWRYSRSVGLPVQAAPVAREHVIAMAFLAASYMPMVIWPTETCATFLLMSGAWFLPSFYAWDRGRKLWEAVGSWT